MDPKIRQLLMQRAQQQGAGQPQPDAENPQEQAMPGDTGEDQQYSLGDGQFDQNPFEALMSQGAGGAPQMNQPQPQAPQGSPMGDQGQGTVGGEDPSLQLQKGQGAGASKFLLGAAQQLQGYISESTNRDEIAIARSILQLLTKLIDKEQETMTSQLDQAVPPQPQAPQGGMGAMMAQMQGGAQGGIPGAAQGQ